MKLEDYKKLVEIQLMTENGLHNILEAKKAYENNEIDKAFNNAKFFKPIIDSNKELFDRIVKKSDQSDELIKNITDSLPLYNQQLQPQTEVQTEAQIEAQTQDVKEESQSITDSEKKIKESKDFVNDIIKGKDVFLYTGKKGDIYTDVKLVDLRNMDKFTKSKLKDYLNSPQLTSLTRKLNTIHQYHPSNKLIESYIKKLREYKEKIKEKITEKDGLPVINEVDDKISESHTPSMDDVKNKISENHTPAMDEVEGQGIKKRRNGYKIVNSKYNDKLLINMDKLYNNYYVEAWFDNNIIYQNQGDKDTMQLLTKGRIDKRKKYSKLSQQIFNDMITLSGMVKKRNGKNKLIGQSNIILNENDRKKRIMLLRSSIIAGNDNKKMQNELARLTNQENVTQDKSIDDIYKDLKTLTPILKTSQGDENVYNHVYNIIDYIRSNKHISREQYHKYIKKHLM